MAEDLLHAAQVGTAFEQVGGGRVPDRVRAGVLHAEGVHDAPRGPRVETAAARPEEPGATAALGDVPVGAGAGRGRERGRFSARPAAVPAPAAPRGRPGQARPVAPEPRSSDQ